jgi:hypothetical protein
MGKRFDDLSKAMASRISRGEALRGMVGGAMAAALAVVFPGRTFASGGNSACAHFCNYVYGEDTPEAEYCTAQAAHGHGPCFQYGPSSPSCRGQVCPANSFCASVSMNYAYSQTYCQSY